MVVVDEISPSNVRRQEEMNKMLAREGIRRDAHLDYSVGAYSSEGVLLATGSSYRNTIRCVAVDGAHRGEGLLAPILTKLLERQALKGYPETFVYTKPDAARMFLDLGFHELERVDGALALLTNRARAFGEYLSSLGKPLPGRSSAVVMNANPFTLGHLHLIERAARESDWLHVFVVSEDVSLFPADVRMRLVREGTAHHKKLAYHWTGSYIVSTATFPSYFLKDDERVIETQAALDARLFSRIAASLGITRRYVGEEPFSATTGIYNRVMGEVLPELGVEVIEIPRKKNKDMPISASFVRAAIHDGGESLDELRLLVPETTWAYLKSEAAHDVIQGICASEDTWHH